MPKQKYTLDIFDNTPTFSQALAINATGQIIGIREVAREEGTILSQEPFFIDGSSRPCVPLLDEYTNIELNALSDNGLVVGYASDLLGILRGSTTGFVWT